MHLRSFVPSPIRLAVQVTRRQWRDLRSGLHRQWARPTHGIDVVQTEHGIETVQNITQSAFYDNKLHNICLAAQRIATVVVQPGAVFSFWQTVGIPARWRGYREGRNLINGQLRSAYGGGLCQVSSLLYHLALQARLEVLERHHHSLDIYTEAERVAPLGADATVVYGYKDLRLRNNLGTPLRFEIEVLDGCVVARMRTTQPIAAHTPTFVRTDAPDGRRVETYVDGQLVAVQEYRVEAKNG